MSLLAWLPLGSATPPLDPTAQQARAQLQLELSKPQYQAARPTLLDQFWQQLGKWLESLLNGVPSPGGIDLTPLLVIGAIVVVLALAVVGYFVFGRPRINARRRRAGALFGTDDDRDALSLRRDAERAAAAGDYTTAIEDAFRAIARGLSERTVVSTFPGTTAHGFASEAAAPFPDFAARLIEAANVFDGVRYLGLVGTQEQWLAVSALERDLRAARPVLADSDAVPVPA